MTPHDSVRVEFESIGRIVNDALDGFVEAAGSPRAEAAPAPPPGPSGVALPHPTRQNPPYHCRTLAGAAGLV